MDNIIQRYTAELKEILINEMACLMGGPKTWPNGINPQDEDSEDSLICVWNEAISRCVEVVRGK